MLSGKQKGVEGEAIATRYLIENGYTILHRNWRHSRSGEIDIIAQKDFVISFIEVKIRSNASCGEGFESITKSKQKQISKLAEIFISNSNFSDKISFKFSVISILGMNKSEITFIEDAFII